MAFSGLCTCDHAVVGSLQSVLSVSVQREAFYLTAAYQASFYHTSAIPLAIV